MGGMTQRQADKAAHILREFVVSMIRIAPQSSLSRTGAGTLSVLHREGPQRITTLAEREAVSQPAMTGLIQRLESTGLVVREPDVLDGRATLIAITEAGRTAMHARRLEHDQAIAQRVAELDRKQLALLLAALPAITSLSEIR